jgi:hypothetical protein
MAGSMSASVGKARTVPDWSVGAVQLPFSITYHLTVDLDLKRGAVESTKSVVVPSSPDETTVEVIGVERCEPQGDALSDLGTKLRKTAMLKNA